MRRKAAVIGPVLALLVMAVPLGAIYVLPEIREVPVDRLAANLEREAKEDPRNIQKVINLARLYAMAFALKSNNVPTTAGPDKVDRPWFGTEDPRIPREMGKSSSREQEATARDRVAEHDAQRAARLLAADRVVRQEDHPERGEHDEHEPEIEVAERAGLRRPADRTVGEIESVGRS